MRRPLRDRWSVPSGGPAWAGGVAGQWPLMVRLLRPEARRGAADAIGSQSTGASMTAGRRPQGSG